MTKQGIDDRKLLLRRSSNLSLTRPETCFGHGGAAYVESLVKELHSCTYPCPCLQQVCT